MIAHVIGTTVEAHFVWDETAYLLLDIGFIWNIYLDLEMGLVPQALAISELEAAEEFKSDLRADVDAISLGQANSHLQRLTVPLVRSPIQGVASTIKESSRRLKLTCETGVVFVETSLATGEVKIYEF